MLERQASAGCSEDYRALTGDPCVPSADLDCADLAADGIRDVEVVGDDPYALDRDGDGMGCEGGASVRTATDLGDSAAEAAPWALPILVVVVVALVSGALLRRAHSEHRAAETDGERRADRFTLFLTLGLAIPLVLIGAFVMAILGLD